MDTEQNTATPMIRWTSEMVHEQMLKAHDEQQVANGAPHVVGNTIDMGVAR